MTDRTIRWGILGTGGIARTFTEDLLILPDHEVTAVGSRTDRAAQAFAATYQIGRAYGSYQELADDPDIDIVYVATPAAQHTGPATACLRAGRAVLVEKPLATSATEAAHLARTARECHLFAMEAMWMRFNPLIQTLCQLIGDGEIGEVRAIYADFGIAVAHQPDHRLMSPELGGGALLDLGIYPVTLATMLLGFPVRIQASICSTKTGVDASTGILLSYPSGAIAALHCGIDAASPQTAHIIGTHGSIGLEAPFFRPQVLTLHRESATPETIRIPLHGHGYTYQAMAVADCLRSGRTECATVPLDESIAVIQLLDDIRAAATVDPATPVGKTAAGSSRQ